MPLTTETEHEHLVETRGIEDFEHDLIFDLGRRLGCLWGYDRCIANADADGRPELQEFWRSVKSQEQRNIDQLKTLIEQHVPSNSY